MNHLHCDFETFSEIDIKKQGLAIYAQHPSTEALMLSWKIDDGPVHLWDIAAGEPMPARLYDTILDDSVQIWAFNAFFEWAIFKYVLNVDLPIQRFRCTMVLAYAMSFKGSLDDVLKQVGFKDNALKIKGGQDLIRRFSKPQGPKRNQVRHDHRNDPMGWESFRQYCIQDTAAEYMLHQWLEQFSPMSEEEWELWFLDHKINWRGAPVDVNLCGKAMDLHAYFRSDIRKELNKLTGLKNSLSNAQMRAWLAEHGAVLPNLKEETVEKWIPQLVGDVRYALELYYQGTRTAGTKWKAFMQRTGEDGRLRGAFQFAGAQRTRRWAGRGVQLHNLRHGPVDNVVAEMIALGFPEVLRMFYGTPMDILASSIRAAVTAPEGKSLVVADLTSIESVVLGHLSGCKALENIYRSGKDAYRVFAQQYFNIPYDQVTKAQRNFSKPPVLGCGFGLGWKGLIKYAAGYGVTMSQQESERGVITFRESYSEIPNMWYDLLEGVEGILTSAPGIAYERYGVRIYRDTYFMYIQLPSGRRLAYYHPVWQEWETPIGERASFTYMGVNRYTNQWTRIASHGGMIVENIVQATARDILAHGMTQFDRAVVERGWDDEVFLIGHVHDEPIAESPNTMAWEVLKLLRKCLTIQPEWLPGIWLGAGGWTGKRYRKD